MIYESRKSRLGANMRYDSDCPRFCGTFWHITKTIKGQSPKTISEYYLDLRMFFRFMKLMRAACRFVQTGQITIRDVDLEFIRSITTSDIFEFLSYLANDRTGKSGCGRPAYGITPTARAQEALCHKSFCKYLTVRTGSLRSIRGRYMEYLS